MARFRASTSEVDAGLAGFLERFVGGTAQIPAMIARQLTGPVHPNCPVRALRQGPDGVLVDTDRGRIAADVVVVALDPGMASRIAVDPPLPPTREALQDRWVSLHEGKFLVYYATPFWREHGLSGAAFGPPPFEIVMDASPSDGSEGVLVVRRAMTPRQWLTAPRPEAAAAYDAAVTDPSVARPLVVDQLVGYFGDEARAVVEFHACEWSGDPWSRGSGSFLPLGLLSSVGEALRPPVGRLVWAGTDTGTGPAMEGAVAAGRRAATEAVALLDVLPRTRGIAR